QPGGIAGVDGHAVAADVGYSCVEIQFASFRAAVEVCGIDILGKLIDRVHGGFANDGFGEIGTGHIYAAARENAAGEHGRSEAFAGALGFAARFAAPDHFAGFGIDDAVIEHHHRFGVSLIAAGYAATRTGNESAHAGAGLAVI